MQVLGTVATTRVGWPAEHVGFEYDMDTANPFGKEGTAFVHVIMIPLPHDAGVHCPSKTYDEVICSGVPVQVSLP